MKSQDQRSTPRPPAFSPQQWQLMWGGIGLFILGTAWSVVGPMLHVSQAEGEGIVIIGGGMACLGLFAHMRRKWWGATGMIVLAFALFFVVVGALTIAGLTHPSVLADPDP